MESIPRRAREETADSNKAEENQPSLIASLAPPPVVPEPRKKPASSFSLRKLSPIPPTQSSTTQQPQQSTVGTKTDNTMISSPSKSSLNQSENRTISNLDKYIDIVSSALKKKNEKHSSGNSVLDRINDGNKRETSKRSGGVDLFGSFQSTSIHLNYFTSDPQSPTFGQIPPLPNTKLPIFPEDFPPNGPKEHKLSWWGIVEPSPELLAMHEKVAEEVGYPIGKRKRGESSCAPGSDRKEETSKKDNDRVDKDQRDADRSKSSRHRHTREKDEKRGRDERKARDRERRYSDRRR